ncbi:MAG: damage-inducible protein DinB [Alphaproteobacteria bacterium]|nr:damage-inducible protein DinB [Alphaproteobacteria bacterium]
MDSSYFRVFADYNQWANARLYDAVAKLPDVEYRKPRQSFFKSIHGTLNHLLVADRIWLSRIEPPQVAMPLNSILYEDFAALRMAREAEDRRVVSLVGAMTTETLSGDLVYTNNSGAAFTTPMAQVLAHLFNHQTHHRGQAHDQLSQTDVAPPELDLMYYLRRRQT